MMKPNSELAKRFADLYLNPKLSREQIIQNLNISKATFYRLVAESKIPCVNVALVAFANTPVSSGSHWWKLAEMPDPYKHDLELAATMSAKLRIRYDFKFLPVPEIYRQLNAGKLDLAYASMTAIPGRDVSFDYSEPYLFQAMPRGVLIQRKQPQKSVQRKQKPILGVVKDSTHYFFARKNWADRFSIRGYSFPQELNLALRAGNIDYILGLADNYNFEAEDLLRIGGPHSYGGRTAIAIASGKEILRRDLNRILDDLYSGGVLQTFEAKYTSR